MTQLPIPVHVGSEPLDHWDDIEARQRQFGEEAAPWLQKQRRPTIASATLDWAALGFTQTELAERLGVSFATVNRWEGDDGRPQPQKAKLVRILALAEAGPVSAALPLRALTLVSGRFANPGERLLGVVGDVFQRRSLGRVRSNCP
jgi:hypothetical protein